VSDNLHVFEIAGDLVVAGDEATVREFMRTPLGDDADTEEIERYPDDKVFAIGYEDLTDEDAAELPGLKHSKRGTPYREMTAAEWAAENGTGWLATTEW
jgi:hypothetical protein